MIFLNKQAQTLYKRYLLDKSSNIFILTSKRFILLSKNIDIIVIMIKKENIIWNFCMLVFQFSNFQLNYIPKAIFFVKF